MARKNITHRRLSRFSIGDFRDRITVHVRTLAPVGFGSADAVERYDVGESIWAGVYDIKPGREEFNNVDTGNGATIRFVIRHRLFGKENVIRWKKEIYEVLRVSSPGERDIFLEMYCRLLGDESLEANS